MKKPLDWYRYSKEMRKAWHERQRFLKTIWMRASGSQAMLRLKRK